MQQWPTLAVHADWSVASAKRWMCLGTPSGASWLLGAPEIVGPPDTLLARLRRRAGTAAIAFGIDCPIGLPRAYAATLDYRDFPEFLSSLAGHPTFFTPAATLDEIATARPFYPARPRAGMTRLSHAQALDLPGAASLGRACDRATRDRPAGAPVLWTLGANQSGKAAISVWRDILIPALARPDAPRLWPFEGSFRALLTPATTVIAETYPAEAMRHLGFKPAGSKRRQADRAAYAPAWRAAFSHLELVAEPALLAAINDGFGADAAGEDRFDCVLGVLCVLNILRGHRSDTAPADPWIKNWEGWVLGQSSSGVAEPQALIPHPSINVYKRF